MYLDEPPPLPQASHSSPPGVSQDYADEGGTASTFRNDVSYSSIGGLGQLQYHQQPSSVTPGLHIYQQAITVVAKMWPDENNTAELEVSGGGTAGWWFLSEDRLPLVVGAFTGVALLLLALFAVALWRCYSITAALKHTYCLKETPDVLPCQSISNANFQDSAICVAGADGQWTYTSHLLMPAALSAPPHWFYNRRMIGAVDQLDATVPRSISVPQPAMWTTSLDGGGCSVSHKRHLRPLSQPVVQFVPCEMSLYSACQFSSSGVLEDHIGRSRSASAPSACIIGESLRSRSLPGWVHSRPYPPLNSEEDLTQMYAQVNLSKKRRNRMRNGEAAIIALSRSRSRCHLLQVGPPPAPLCSAMCSGAQAGIVARTGKTEESLDDQEAVLVYDERTAV